MNIPLRGLMIVAVVVSLASAVTTTYLASESASVAAQLEATHAPSTTTTEPPPPSADTNQQPAEPTCPSGQHFENGPGTPCVWNMDKVPQNNQPDQPSFDQGQQNFGNQNGQGFQGPSDEEMQKQQAANDARMVKEQKKHLVREAKELINMLRFGGKKSDEVKKILANKQAEVKILQIEAEAVSTMDELQAVREKINAFRDEWQETMSTLQEKMQNEEQLDRMRREVKNLERGLKQFKSQLSKLARKKIAIPPEISDSIAKVETIITTIKTAKTWAEVEAVGGEGMWDAFQELEENRPQLEMLSRWPQMKNQINRDVKRLERELKSAKKIVDRLGKKEIDLSVAYDEFKAAVDAIKAARDRAQAAVTAGNAEEAFDILESEVFGQMEEVWNHAARIQMMNNLGRFASESQRGIADGQKKINMLKRKKIDTLELQDLLNQAKEKRAEVLALIKDKEADSEDIFGAMQEMDGMRMEFEALMAELTGEEERMPWEQGPQQFKSIEAPKGWEGMSPQGGGPGGPGGPGPMGPGGPGMGGPGMGPDMGPGGF